MDYTKVSANIEPNTQNNRDILSAILSQFEYDSFEETESGLNAFIKTELFNEDDIKNSIVINEEIVINYTIEKIKGENWNKIWEENFNPVFLNENCVIRASFHKIDPMPEIDVIIDPKMAFGTGHHNTTFLAAQELFETKIKNKYILDMGCGTGILSIIASQLGAKEIIAIDNDSDATQSTIENLKLNKIKNVKTILGDAKTLKKYKDFDLIIANINRNILLNDMGKYAEVLSSKGRIILSGFYKIDLPILVDKAKTFNLELDKFSIKEDWTMAILKPAKK